MAEQRSPAVTGLTSLAAVAGVAVLVGLSMVHWVLAGIVGGLAVAGYLVWTVGRAVDAPDPLGSVRSPVSGPPVASAPPRAGHSASTRGRSRDADDRSAAATASGASTTADTATASAASTAATGAPAAPATRAAEARTTWTAATGRHDDVLEAYGRWELDPRMLLSYPALWDYSVPANQEFFSALERASQLRTGEIPGGPARPDADAVETYDAVTRRLRTAWAVAEQQARRTGREGLSESLHRDADRALKLLNHADGAATDAEAATYLSQASTIVHRLAERGVIPDRTRAELELEKRRQRALESGPGTG